MALSLSVLRRNQNRRAKRTLVVYQRSDMRWGWKLLAPNGHTVAVDGNQGYTNKSDAIDMGESVTGLSAMVSEP